MLKEKQIATLIENDKNSALKRRFKKGRKYYEGEHDILNYRLYYYNSDGILVEDKTRSNIKICHSFFTELVDQCVQYELSGAGPFVKSDIPELQEKLNVYFGEDFISELAETLTDVCAGGFGYMYAYKNSENRTTFVYAEADGVVEVRAKDTDDNTEYNIYWYVDRTENEKKIKRIQVWDSKAVTYFVQVENGMVELDHSEPINPRPHIVYKRDNEEGRYGDSLGYIPFFRMDNNRKQTSHLEPVKPLIDDYDLMACGLSNNLQDASEYLVVVKGFQGDNLEELINNVKVKKHIGVDENGGLDFKTVDIPYEARKIKLEIDEKNIYRFGMGLNISGLKDTSATTNIAIKTAYALLDVKCNKLETRLKAFLKGLVKIALDEINKTDGTGYQLSDVSFDFKREVMTNAADNASIAKTEAETQQIKINTVLNAASQLDDETVVKAICDILEVDYDTVKSAMQGDAVNLNVASELLVNVNE